MFSTFAIFWKTSVRKFFFQFFIYIFWQNKEKLKGCYCHLRPGLQPCRPGLHRVDADSTNATSQRKGCTAT